MDRYPEYRYTCGEIKETEGEIWIYIHDKDDSGWEKLLFDFWEDDGPVELMLRIKESNNWTVVDMGMGRFTFEEDKQKLIFQWDDLFGLAVVVDDIEKVEYVRAFIEKCNRQT